MEEDDAYLEHIESDEIKKLVERIYKSKPEESIVKEESNNIYDEIVKKIDMISIETPINKKEIVKK